VLESFRWPYLALNKALRFQHGVDIFTLLARMHNSVAYWKFKVLTYVGIQAHYITVLNGLTLTYLLVEVQSHGSTPVQRVSGV
jgi:hypothetical protein